MLVYAQTLDGPERRQRFESIYTACQGRMLTLARRYLPTREDAEDAVHQAFLSLAEHFHRLARLPRPELEAYLTVVVERKCIDLLRQQARLSGTPFDETLPLVTPPPCGDTLADAMGRLPPRYREALLLRHACGYSTRETAALLELSFAAAQKLLYRARDALRAELEKEAISL